VPRGQPPIAFLTSSGYPALFPRSPKAR